MQCDGRDVKHFHQCCHHQTPAGPSEECFWQACPSSSLGNCYHNVARELEVANILPKHVPPTISNV